MSYRDNDLVWDALKLLFKYTIRHSQSKFHQSKNDLARSWDDLLAERQQRNKDEQHRLNEWRS